MPAPSLKDASPHTGASAANRSQGENLSGFLHRANFNLSSLTDRSRSPAATLKPPALKQRSNNATPSLTDFGQPKSRQEAAQLTQAQAVFPWQQTASNPPSVRSYLTEVPTERRSTPISPSRTAPTEDRTLLPSHSLPVYALSQTLRSSSIGATMAPGIVSETDGLGWSKYAPGGGSRPDGQSSIHVNQHTVEGLARQEAINSRLSALRARRGTATEQREEVVRRQELLVAEKKAAEEQARVKAERIQREQEESDRLKREKEETERVQREKQEAARRQREKEETERLQREKEELQHLQREKEELERRQREQEKAERLQREKEEAERLQREKEEAERLQREKDGQEDAFRRSEILQKIDQQEFEGLAANEANQEVIKKEIDEVTARHEEVTSKHQAKKNEVSKALTRLANLQHEEQALMDEEATVTAELDAANKKLSDVLAQSEQIMERAENMRKKLEDKSVRATDLKVAFNFSDFPKDDDNAPKYGKTLFGDQSPPESVGCTKSEPSVDEKTAEMAKAVEAAAAAEQSTEAGQEGQDSEVKSTDGGSDDLSKQFVFKSWPKSEFRPFEGVQNRLVKLTNLPVTCNMASIQSLVWGGRIEKFDHTPGNSFGWALFMRGEDCEKYFKATANGISYPGDGNRTVWVEMCEPVRVNEFLRGAYNSGFTRCVRAVGVDADWSQTALNKLAASRGRKVERVVHGVNPSGLRVVEFRFTNMTDSVRFRHELQHDIDWEHCNIYHGDDPCANNTGVHSGIH